MKDLNKDSLINKDYFFIDTHAHLDMIKGMTPEFVVQESLRENVRYIINVGSSISGSKKSSEYATKFDNVFASVGVHPHYVENFNKDKIKILEDLIKNNPKIVAVGETGFDYFRNLSPKDDQKRAFEMHIELAQNCKLPLIVHDRDAHNDILNVLKYYYSGYGAVYVDAEKTDYSDTNSAKCVDNHRADFGDNCGVDYVDNHRADCIDNCKTDYNDNLRAEFSDNLGANCSDNIKTNYSANHKSGWNAEHKADYDAGHKSDNEVINNFKVVIHCFSGSTDFALKCIELGFYISFTGVITFPNAKSLVQTVKEVPIERIFIETDAPFLAPQEKRGKENYPGYVVYVAKKISEIKQVPLEYVAKTTFNNALNFFNIK